MRHVIVQLNLIFSEVLILHHYMFKDCWCQRT